MKNIFEHEFNFCRAKAIYQMNSPHKYVFVSSMVCQQLNLEKKTVSSHLDHGV